MTSLNNELSYCVEEKMITSIPQNGVLYRRIILILGMHVDCFKLITIWFDFRAKHIIK